MTRLFRLLLLGLLVPALPVLTAWAQTDSLLYDRLRRAEGVDLHLTPIGLCEDYPEESTTLDIIRRDMELLKRTGVKLLRISFGWDGVEGAEDRYDWLFWDDFVRIAVDEYGITLIPYICYTPQWNATRSDPNEFWRSPPKDYDEFGEFVGDIVNRYKGRIKSWELWNEPDIEWYWMGSHEEFARLVRTGSEAVRKADPEALIVLGGISHETDWLRTLFREHGIAPYVDVVNMHNYYETWHEPPLEEITDFINTVDDIVHRYGEGEPLWMAEVGYSSVREGSKVSYNYTAYYDYEHTVEYQAVDLVRRITAALATDKLSALAWYEIKDLPPAEQVIGDLNNRYLGVAYRDHTPKPAERAITFTNRLYGEPMRSIDREVMVTRPIGSDAYVHAFEQEDGDVIVVGWLQTRRLGQQGAPGEGAHRDTRRETVTVTLHGYREGAATLYNALGEPAPFEAVEPRDGRTNLQLTLEGGQVYVVVLPKE